MAKLKTIDIKGKKYVTVNERLKYFRENFPGYSLESEVIEITEEFAVVRAVVRNETGVLVATGLAREVRLDASAYVNKTSYLENCETSAWGRALANFGIGVDESVASADEVTTAIAAETSRRPGTKQIVTDETGEVLKAIGDKLGAFSSPEIFAAWIVETCKVKPNELSEDSARKIINFLTEQPDVAKWPRKHIEARDKVIAESQDKTPF